MLIIWRRASVRINTNNIVLYTNSIVSDNNRIEMNTTSANTQYMYASSTYIRMHSMKKTLLNANSIENDRRERRLPTEINRYDSDFRQFWQGFTPPPPPNLSLFRGTIVLSFSFYLSRL